MEDKVLKLLQKMYKMYIEMNNRFEQVDKRFGQIDKRFGQVDTKSVTLEQRIEENSKQIHNISVIHESPTLF